MDPNLTRRYPKLKVKRTRKPINKLTNEAVESSDSIGDMDPSNFKIRRFMKDVNKYGVENKVEDPKTHDAPTCNEKGDAGARVSLKGKQGLFERGVSTKMYSRGLLPPLWNARLNADLQSVLKLANGKKQTSRKPFLEEENRRVKREQLWNKISGFNSQENANYEDETACSKRLDSECNASSAGSPVDNLTSVSEERRKEYSKREKVRKKRFDDGENTEDKENEIEAESTDAEKADGEIPLQTKIRNYRPNGQIGLARSDRESPMPNLKMNNNVYTELYLEFSHFIIKSLCSSRIDKHEMENYSNNIKSSLTEVYRRSYEKGMSEKEEGTPPSRLRANRESIEINSPSTMRKYPPSPLKQCPFTSRSDEGHRREAVSVMTDSQLSDDIVTRKQGGSMYTSGMEFLKAVYGKSSKNEACNLSPPGCTFSTPVENDASKDNPCTYLKYAPAKAMFSHCCTDIKDFQHSLKRPICCSSSYTSESSSTSTCNRDDDNPSTTLRYWPGYSRQPTHASTTYSRYSRLSEPLTSLHRYGQLGAIRSSTDYLSLLPPSQHLPLSRYPPQLYGTQFGTNVGMDGSGDHLPSHSLAPYLALPLHPPPRKSPEIQYYPRKMF